jgi:hypothetical protein
MGRIRLQIDGHSEALQRAHDETDLSTRFSLFNLYEPFPAGPGSLPETLVFLNGEFAVLLGRNSNPISSLTLEKRLSAC